MAERFHVDRVSKRYTIYNVNDLNCGSYTSDGFVLGGSGRGCSSRYAEALMGKRFGDLGIRRDRVHVE